MYKRTIILLFFFYFYNIYSQTTFVKLNDNERYLKFNREDILNIVNQYNNEPNELIFYLEEKLKEFSKANLNEKNDVGKGKFNSEFSSPRFFWAKELSGNARRLSLREIELKPIDGFFIRESDSLFFLHWQLALAFMKISLPLKNNAASHLVEAQRYRSLKISSNILKNQDNIAIATNPSFKKLGAQLQNTNLDADDNLKKEYSIFENLWNNESVLFLKDAAKIMKSFEETLGEKEKNTTKQSLQKSTFIKVFPDTYSNNSNFSAYINFLEMARRLAPDNPKIPLEIANELETRGKSELLLLMYENILVAQDLANDNNKLSLMDISKIHFELGGLYYIFKNYAMSNNYYQKALNVQQIPFWIFTYANLLSDHIGNYTEAINLYKKYLDTTIKIEDNNDGESTYLKETFIANWKMAECYLKLNEFSKAITQASEAKDIFLKLHTKIMNTKIELKKLQIDLSKQQAKYDQKEINSFLELQNRQKEIGLKLSLLETAYKSLPIRNIFFKLAEWLTIEQRLPLAIAIYKEAEQEGIDANEARHKYKALEKILYP